MHPRGAHLTESVGLDSRSSHPCGAPNSVRDQAFRSSVPGAGDRPSSLGSRWVSPRSGSLVFWFGCITRSSPVAVGTNARPVLAPSAVGDTGRRLFELGVTRFDAPNWGASDRVGWIGFPILPHVWGAQLRPSQFSTRGRRPSIEFGVPLGFSQVGIVGVLVWIHNSI